MLIHSVVILVFLDLNELQVMGQTYLTDQKRLGHELNPGTITRNRNGNQSTVCMITVNSRSMTA